MVSEIIDFDYDPEMDRELWVELTHVKLSIRDTASDRGL
jgi:hypothetical protein